MPHTINQEELKEARKLFARVFGPTVGATSPN
jgi:hypothetical protein